MNTLTVKSCRFFDGERLHTGQQLNITIRGGRIVHLSDERGHVVPDDLRILGEPERYLKLVIRGGEVVLNRLTEKLQ
jgi:hypothetical protein